MSGKTKEFNISAEYFDNLLSHISPLIALDEEERVRFVNQSFLEEFSIARAGAINKNASEVLNLTTSERAAFRDNLDKSRDHRVENCNFKIDGKIFGYSIFPFDQGAVVILKNITELKKLERKVALLYSRLLKIQEKEQQRLAQELHDSVGQTILAAKLNFVACRKDPDAFEENFDRGMKLIDQTSQELREIYTNLYPSTLKELGLEAAIRGFTRNFLELKTIRTALNIQLGPEAERLIPADIKTNVFRITQEAFGNIIKHSWADFAELSLRLDSDQALLLTINDNGIGFLPRVVSLKSRGYGLENIRRRVEDLNGVFRVESEPGMGTTLEIQLPLSQVN